MAAYDNTAMAGLAILQPLNEVQLAAEAKAKRAAYNKAACEKRKPARLAAGSATAADEQVTIFYKAFYKVYIHNSHILICSV